MHQMDEEEVEAVRRVLLSKKLFRYTAERNGECFKFEREFSAYLGSHYAVMVTSGTNALIAALKSLNISEGDEVLIPAYTFVATAMAVSSVGATAVIVGIDNQLSFDFEELEKKITKKTKAIIPVHMDGRPCPMDKILLFAKKYNLFIVEDCAQALGGSYQGKKLGTFGNIGCFSFNQDKNLTCGEGGIVVTNDPILYERLFCLQDGSAVFNPANKDFYKHITPFLGYSMRVSEISAAIMRVQLGRLENILLKLREKKHYLSERIKTRSFYSVIEPHCLEGDCATSFHIRCHDVVLAQRFGAFLRSEGFLLFPPTLRSAHVAWKWAPLFNISKSEFLFSLESLSATLKFDLRIDLSREEMDKMINLFSQFLKSCQKN